MLNKLISNHIISIWKFTCCSKFSQCSNILYY